MITGININGTFLDLRENTRVIFDIATNTIGEIETRQGVTTNEFTVPATKNNRITCGCAVLEGSIYFDNVEVEKGFFKVFEIDENENNIVLKFYSNNAIWFDAIADQSLRDVDLSQFHHKYTVENVVKNLNKKNGFIYPLANYGRIDTYTGSPAFLFEIGKDIFPAIFQRDLLRSIFNERGFKVEGTLFDDARFQKEILAFSNQYFQYTSLPDFNTQLRYFDDFFGVLPYPMTITSIAQGGEYVDLSLGRLTNTSKKGLVVRINAFISIDMPATGAAQIHDVYVEIYDELNILTATHIISTVTLPAGGAGVFEIENAGVVFDLLDGHYLRTYYNTEKDNPLDPATLEVPNELNALIAFELLDEYTIKEGFNVVLEETLPDIDLTDYVKDIIFRYGVLVNYEQITKTITFNTFLRLYENIPNAINWSQRIDVSRSKVINFTDLTVNYARQNNLIFVQSEDNKNIIYEKRTGLPFGSGVFSLNDRTLEREKDLYESPFSGTFSDYAFITANWQMFLPEIRIWSERNIDEPDIDPQPRILLIETGIDTIDLIASNLPFSSPIFIEGATDSEGVQVANHAWFYKATALPELLNSFTDSLAWQPQIIAGRYQNTFLAFYWSNILKLLRQSQIFKAYIKIDVLEVLNIDYSIPYYFEFEEYTGYYYLDSIEDFDGESTYYLCNFIKL